MGTERHLVLVWPQHMPQRGEGRRLPPGKSGGAHKGTDKCQKSWHVTSRYCEVSVVTILSMTLRGFRKMKSFHQGPMK